MAGRIVARDLTRGCICRAHYGDNSCRQSLLPPILGKSMRVLMLILTILLASPARATDATVRDGDTIQLADVTYRLDGIDAPEFDQMCIDEHADAWACRLE